MDRTLIKPVAFLDVLVTVAVAVGGLKVPDLVPRGRDPFGQRRGSRTPGDAVAPITIFIFYNCPEGYARRRSSILRPLKFALIDGFLQVNFPVLPLWVRGNDSFKCLRSES